MSDIEYMKTSFGLVKKPKFRVDEDRVAKIRERQRRERKVKLYSFSPEKILTI